MRQREYELELNRVIKEWQKMYASGTQAQL
jgi:hypothetical protein